MWNDFAVHAIALLDSKEDSSWPHIVHETALQDCTGKHAQNSWAQFMGWRRTTHALAAEGGSANRDIIKCKLPVCHVALSRRQKMCQGNTLCWSTKVSEKVLQEVLHSTPTKEQPFPICRDASRGSRCIQICTLLKKNPASCASRIS